MTMTSASSNDPCPSSPFKGRLPLESSPAIDFRRAGRPANGLGQELRQLFRSRIVHQLPEDPCEADDGICFPEKDSEFKKLLNPKENSKPPLERKEPNRFRIQGLVSEDKPLPKTILARRTGRLRSASVVFRRNIPNPAKSRRRFGIFLPKHRPPTHRTRREHSRPHQNRQSRKSAWPPASTSSAPLSPRTPLFSVLRSGPTAVSGASRQKQFLAGPPSWTPQRLFLEPHAKSNFLAAIS